MAGTRPRDFPLAERLRAMRHRWKETQRDFARHFPVTRNTYCNWERSGVPPGPTAMMVKMILKKLGKIHLDRNREWDTPQEHKRRRERYLATGK